MSMDLDQDASAPAGEPAPKKPEKKQEEGGKIVGSSNSTSPGITPVGKQTLFGAGGMPASTTFVSGSATYPTYTNKPTATSAPAVTSVMSPNKPVRPDSQPSSSAASPAPSSSGSTSFPADTTALQVETTKPGSVEDKLSDLERRFEGCTHSDWPVLKRLEQLEIKVAGQASSGRIIERIDALQKL